jgi:hypothetical protein
MGEVMRVVCGVHTLRADSSNLLGFGPFARVGDEGRGGGRPNDDQTGEMGERIGRIRNQFSLFK